MPDIDQTLLGQLPVNATSSLPRDSIAGLQIAFGGYAVAWLQLTGQDPVAQDVREFAVPGARIDHGARCYGR